MENLFDRFAGGVFEIPAEIPFAGYTGQEPPSQHVGENYKVMRPKRRAGIGSGDRLSTVQRVRRGSNAQPATGQQPQNLACLSSCSPRPAWQPARRAFATLRGCSTCYWIPQLSERNRS